ncbi:MAG: hypothetical protein ACI360_00005, partial [Atopobiaceae bacterium]
MSNHESKTPRHARHFAQNPNEATFRFSPVDPNQTRDADKRDANGSMDKAAKKVNARQHVIDPEATQLASPDVDPEATQLVSPGTYDPEATRLVDSAAAATMAGNPN